MHLLQATPGQAPTADQAVRLVQSPGDIVFLSAADTELAALAAARAGCPDSYPSLRVASLLQLSHPMTVDLYLDEVIARAKLVIVRVIGGLGYWSYGVEQIAAAGIPCAFLPGDERPDEDLSAWSRIDPTDVDRLWRYCLEGGPANMRALLDHAAGLIGHAAEAAMPMPLPRAGFYRPNASDDRPLVPIVFARSFDVQDDAMQAQLGAFAQAFAQAILDWAAQHEIQFGQSATPAYGQLVFDVTLFAQLSGNSRPLLRLRELQLALGDIANPNA